MEALLITREGIIKYYKKFEPIITVLLRFLLGVYVFSLIHEIGYIHPDLASHLQDNRIPLVVLLGIAFAVLPLTLGYLIMILDITLQYSYHVEVAAVIFVFLICILLFYARMAAKESILILLTVLSYRFGMPYLIPLIAGLYFSVTAIIPVAIGIFIATFIPEIGTIVATIQTPEFTIADMITEMPDTFGDIYSALINALTNTSDWVFSAFLFAMVIVMVYAISRAAIDFAREIAIGLGCAVMIFGYILGNILGNVTVQLQEVILMTLLCGLLTMLLRLFDPILDYQRAESVQFEDDNNYYYVRVVPKIRLTRPNRVVRRIRPQPEEDEE